MKAEKKQKTDELLCSAVKRFKIIQECILRKREAEGLCPHEKLHVSRGRRPGTLPSGKTDHTRTYGM